MMSSALVVSFGPWTIHDLQRSALKSMGHQIPTENSTVGHGVPQALISLGLRLPQLRIEVIEYTCFSSLFYPE